MNDMDDATDWTETESGLDAAHVSVHRDFLKITGQCNDAGDEYAYYLEDIPDISSSTYTTYLVRWKTSHSSDGLGARVRLDFSVDQSDYQDVVGADAPEFSEEWKVSTGTVTAAKTIKRVLLFADDYPNSVSSGTYYVWYDFVLLCQGQFSFPIGGRFDVVKAPRIAVLDPPSRHGDISQMLGSKSAVFKFSAEMTTNSAGWKRSSPTADTVEGQVFDQMFAEGDSWQWLTTARDSLKVQLQNLGYSYRDKLKIVNVDFVEYRRSSGSNETYAERFGFV